MTAKRLLVGLVAFGLAGLGFAAVELAPAVFAQQQDLTQPHGGYSSDTELCEVCHDWHAEIDAGVEPEQVRSYPWEQLLTEPSELELCYTCHDGSGATTNIEAEFGADTRTSFHPVLQPADEIQLACSDCHAQHQSPDEDTKLLYRETSPGAFLFSPPDAPIGDTFCYGCHGSASTLPPPFGDHGAFETSIHATSDRVDPPTPGTDLKCSACHESHASDYRYLTRANEEELCYTCHATADPNTANGSNPQNAFTAVPNDYATDDGTGSRSSTTRSRKASRTAGRAPSSAPRATTHTSSRAPRRPRIPHGPARSTRGGSSTGTQAPATSTVHRTLPTIAAHATWRRRRPHLSLGAWTCPTTPTW
jgi:predicted CXXCH cytochrome family protein